MQKPPKRRFVMRTGLFYLFLLVFTMQLVRANSDGAKTLYPIIENETQAASIRGSVSDAEGNPMPGVNIIEKGTNNGTTTDAGGIYSLQVSDGDVILVFSFIGFVTQEIPVNGRSVIDISLNEDIRSLSEVVVIGYGEQRKTEVTGAVANVTSEDFIQGNVRDAADLIQGKVAGLTVVTPTGDPTRSMGFSRNALAGRVLVGARSAKRQYDVSHGRSQLSTTRLRKRLRSFRGRAAGPGAARAGGTGGESGPRFASGSGNHRPTRATRRGAPRTKRGRGPRRRGVGKLARRVGWRAIRPGSRAGRIGRPGGPAGSRTADNQGGVAAAVGRVRGEAQSTTIQLERTALGMVAGA